MLKMGIVWQEETFKIEKNIGYQGSLIFSFLAFLCSAKS